MANKVARVNFPQLFLLIIIVACSGLILVRTASEDDFSEKIHQKSSNGLVPRWIWSMSKASNPDIDGYLNIFRRTLGAVGAILTIWIFLETRNKQFDEQATNDLLEELNLQLENLNLRVEEVQISLLEMACLYEASKVQSKNEVVARNCLQSFQQNRQADTYAHLLTGPSHFSKDMQIMKRSVSPILVRWLGYNV